MRTEPLGVVAAMCDYNWEEGRRRLTLATAGDSGSPLSRMIFGLLCLNSGQPAEALEHLQRAIREDPLHQTYRVTMATSLGALGRLAEAEELLKQSLEMAPEFFWNHFFVAALYASQHRFAEALPFAERAFSLAPWDSPSVGLYAGALVRVGETARAHDVLQHLGTGDRYSQPSAFALFHICCGEMDLAAHWFEQAIDERHTLACTYMQSAIGKPLRESRYWPKLARMMNLPTRP